MTTTFDYDDARGRAALARMKRAGDGPTAIGGEDWTQGAMAALLDAEFLAAEAGLVPWVQLPTGERGLLTVGAAREHLEHAPPDVRTIYLATHALVRSTHATAVPWSGDAPKLEAAHTRALAAPLGDPTGGILIALTVVAIAAIIGTAWYFTRRETIQVDGRNLRTTAIASEVSNLAREQLARTGKIDPELWSVFRSLADAEAPSWMPWAIGGGVVAVAGGIAAYAWWRSKQQPQRKGT